MTDVVRYTPPDWAFAFHGHRCPFMPLGYRMGLLALEHLGVAREQDHGLHVICELGEGHPQTCLMDGIQVATGATFGKALMEKVYWGKLAATFWHPKLTPVRYVLKTSFLDAFGGVEFFSYRKRGIEPSQIPQDVTDTAIAWTLSQSDDDVFTVTDRPDFAYAPPRGSFNRQTCSVCGEIVFERYLRLRDGKPVCPSCSGDVR